MPHFDSRSTKVILAGAGLLMSASLAKASTTDVGTSLLTGSTAAASDGGVFGGAASTTIDGVAANSDQDGDFLFANVGTETLQYSTVSAPNGIATVRYYTAPADTQREATNVEIYTSTSNLTSTDPADYTDNGGFNPFTTTAVAYGNNTADQRAYFDYTLATPAAPGTQSVLVVFTPNSNGTRVYEFQAFAATPEPTSLGLLGVSSLGLLARRRRV